MTPMIDPAGADMSAETNYTDGATALASAAIAYAEHDVAIFPVQPRGKAPAIPKCPDAKEAGLVGDALAAHATTCPNDGHGFHDATTDLDTIRRWWTERPDANIGIALGANRIFTVDVDGPEGRAALDELEATYGPLPPTYQVITGRIEGSGRHHIYRQPDDCTVPNGKLGHPKLEIKGDGGYVVAPPSIHQSGRPYLAVGSWAQIAASPRWLIVLATKPEPAAPIGDTYTDAGTGHDQLADKRLRGLAGNLAIMAPDTGRNNALNHAAYVAGQLVGAGRLDRHHAEQVLTLAAERAGLTPTETAATITSGITAGTTNPDHDGAPTAPLTIPTVTTLDNPATAPTSSWAPVDGTDYINGTWTPPNPTQLARTDGTFLFYPGRINLLFGESEAGKGWVTLLAVAQALERGDTVLYIDFEDYPDTIYSRLKLLGTPHVALTDRFRYIRPDHALDDPGRHTLGHTVTDLDPALVILDGVTGAMSLHALDTNQSTDVDQFYTLLGEPLARHGAAVIFIDHVVKAAEGRGKGPIGSQHKRARVSGASYEVSAVQPIAPGRTGRLRLRIDKDRLGAIRSGHPTQAGDFVLDSTDPDQSTAAIYAATFDADAGDRKVQRMMVRLSQALEDAGDAGLSIRGINEVGGSAKEVIREAVDQLVEGGYVSRHPGPNRSLIHRFERRYVDGLTVLSGVPEQRSISPGVPGGVPMSPSVPNASGTPLAAKRESGVPVSPALYRRGHRDTGEADPKNTHPDGHQEIPL